MQSSWRLSLWQVVVFVAVSCAVGATDDVASEPPSKPPGHGEHADAVPFWDAPAEQPDAPLLPKPDAAVMCLAPCELVSQCGCKPGEACDLDDTAISAGSHSCRKVTLAGSETSTCHGLDECASGYACVGPSGQTMCHRYCDD